MLWVTIGLLFILLCVYCIRDSAKPKNYPPGPAWLPILGCYLTYHYLRKKCQYNYMVFQKLSRQYGPLVGLKFGGQRIVVVSTYDMVKRVVLRDDFNGRPDGFFFKLRSFGKRQGVLFTDGVEWAQCRRFTMRHLRMFGLGQPSMGRQLAIESSELINHLRGACERGPVAMHKIFDVPVLNSLWCMFAGHRYEYDDDKLQDMILVVTEAFRVMDTAGGMISHMPFLCRVMPQFSGYNDIVRILTCLWNFLEDEIAMHERRRTDGEPDDLIDAFLREISSRSQEGGDAIFHRENLLVLCLDLFLAGMKTTADTLAYAFIFLMHNDRWIEIIQAELDGVVGRSRSPVVDDMPSLPMTEAFLAETQRCLNLAPLGVPHRTTKDVDVNGHRIPKDTLILFDFHSVHNDKLYWDDPQEFRPRRFIDEEGRYRPNACNIPFGIGKRRCLGEILARSSLFMFFTNILHYFNPELSPEHGKPDSNGEDGFTIAPKPYYLKLSVRSDVED